MAQYRESNTNTNKPFKECLTVRIYEQESLIILKMEEVFYRPLESIKWDVLQYSHFK